MPAATSPEPMALKHDKKSKKDKSSKSEKKRAREEDAATDAGHKRKKSRNIAADLIDTDTPTDTPEAAENTGNEIDRKKSKKNKDKRSKDGAGESKSEKKKHKRSDKHADGETAPGGVEPAPQSDGKELKRKHKKKSKDVEEQSDATDEASGKAELKKKKKSKKQRAEEDAVADNVADPDTMDVDEVTPPSKAYQPRDIPANPQFPFFTQTVSLYEPIYAVGWDQPVTNSQYQHLQHLQNRYVPSLHGVLIDYKNVTLGEHPGREGAAVKDEDVTVLKSQNEFGGGFGWITADVELFVPSRGAWMEGSINLQTEGHIGVVCFGKFNASIEARRLPATWKWVANEDPNAMGMEETASVITANDHGVVRQIHSTGFWVDGDGAKVKGNVRFRIRNFDAGGSGETSYLSLEGTMLDKEGEKKLVMEEARLSQMRRDIKGGRKIERRRAPDFSMTRFAAESKEQTDGGEQDEAEAITGEIGTEATPAKEAEEEDPFQ